MRLANRKSKRKNRGNTSLSKEVDKLIGNIQAKEWKDQTELNETRSDADCVHLDGFYFFNISVNRTMVLLEFEDGEASVVWVGIH